MQVACQKCGLVYDEPGIVTEWPCTRCGAKVRVSAFSKSLTGCLSTIAIGGLLLMMIAAVLYTIGYFVGAGFRDASH